MAQAFVGTSGFSYDEWRGRFYPAELPKDRFLAHYASRLPAVEIDATFYRMPTPRALDAWRAATPEPFRFALKAPRKITHFERLLVPSESLDYFVGVASRLGPRLGAILFQLPPFLKPDLRRLDALLRVLPKALPIAFEFRNPGWLVEEVFDRLAERSAALCIDDRDGAPPPPLRVTSGFTYLRLRRDYDARALGAWARRIRDWVDEGVDVLAFVKHEDNPDAPAIAEELARRVREGWPSSPSRPSIPSTSARERHAT